MTDPSIRCLLCYQSKADAFKPIVSNSNMSPVVAMQMQYMAHPKVDHVALRASASCLLGV
jgi:hypothetical protein